MSEAQAIAIDKNTPGVLDWFVQIVLNDNPLLTLEAARR
jgi:hypothetical protein